MSTSNIWIRSYVLQKVTKLEENDDVTSSRRTFGTTKITQIDRDFGWGWVHVELLSQTDNELSVLVDDDDCPRCDGKKLTICKSIFKDGDTLMANIHETDANGEEILPPNNLIDLPHLHEPAVVHCLRKRYAFDKVYTATGPILLAINPFKMLAGLYSDQKMDMFWDRGVKAAKGELDDPFDLGPHVFGNADHAFRKMMSALEMQKSSASSDDGKKKKKRAKGKNKKSATASGLASPDQSLLVSGESGAGKTVTTKFIMKYLATVSERVSEGASFVNRRKSRRRSSMKRLSLIHDRDSFNRKNLQREKGNVEEKIVQSNPILESFGNARTHRNDNSSRFGKFIEMKFTERGTLIGAAVNTYLLEKVRLVDPSPGERNYHIFYEMIEGACAEDGERLFLDDTEFDDYKLLSKSGTYDRRDGVDDDDNFSLLEDAFQTMGFEVDEETDILSITAALLHAGNLTLEKVTGDKCTINDDEDCFEAVISLLQVEKEAFIDAICHCNVTIGGETFKRNVNIAAAQNGLESLIKATYNALFNHLVERINTLINSDTSRTEPQAAFIGVLDIFGFESFKVNSFEQLCINYCNEALQQQFNRFVFKNEQEEYANEGIEWSNIEFPDNQDALDLIAMKNTGLLSILDEHCRIPNATDKTFASDVYKKCPANNRFSATRGQIGFNKFSVRHYAGKVEYLITGFVEKNKNDLPREATMLLESSKCSLVKDLVEKISDDISGSDSGKKTQASSAAAGARKKKQMTVGGHFTRQLDDLREKIDATSPHYIRCMKPNDELEPDNFNPVNISEQLTCAGVIEAVKVSRVGFPQRFVHDLFLERYGMLDSKWHKIKNATQKTKSLVEALSDTVSKGGAQMGKTKVFMKAEAFETLEKMRAERMQIAVVIIQKHARKLLAKTYLKKSVTAVLRIATRFRMRMATKLLEQLRRNKMATVMAAYYRRYTARRRYVSTMAMARWLQRVHRGRMGRFRYDELNRIRKATVIETAWRMHYLRQCFAEMKQAALIIQCLVRCRIAKQKLRKLRLEAKDLGAIKVERDRLKVEVETLRAALQETSSKSSENNTVADEAKEGERRAIEEAERYKNETLQLKAALEESQLKYSEDIVRFKETIEELTIANQQLEEAKIPRTEDRQIEMEQSERKPEEANAEVEEAKVQGEKKALEEVERYKSEVEQLKVTISEDALKYNETIEELAIAKKQLEEARNARAEPQDKVVTSEQSQIKIGEITSKEADVPTSSETLEELDRLRKELKEAKESEATLEKNLDSYKLKVYDLQLTLDNQADIFDKAMEEDDDVDAFMIAQEKQDELIREVEELRAALKEYEDSKQSKVSGVAAGGPTINNETFVDLLEALAQAKQELAEIELGDAAEVYKREAEESKFALKTQTIELDEIKSERDKLKKELEVLNAALLQSTTQIQGVDEHTKRASVAQAAVATATLIGQIDELEQNLQSVTKSDELNKRELTNYKTRLSALHAAVDLRVTHRLMGTSVPDMHVDDTVAQYQTKIDDLIITVQKSQMETIDAQRENINLRREVDELKTMLEKAKRKLSSSNQKNEVSAWQWLAASYSTQRLTG